MEDNRDVIKAENKKALPKFAAIIAVSLAGGMALGLALVFLSRGDFGGALEAAGQIFTQKIAGWLLIALPVVELAACLPICLGAKRRLADWDGEDEAVGSKIETRLSVCLWITGMTLILSFFLLAAMISGFVDMAGNPMQVAPVKFFGGLAAFLIGGLGVSTVLQQKLVDMTKKLNPEKRGSVYDVKFQAKWLESCDEAERAVIGQCAFKAYTAVSRTCLALWVAFTLGGMYFSWDFLPAMAVCIVWGVGQSVYCYWAVRLSKPGTAL